MIHLVATLMLQSTAVQAADYISSEVVNHVQVKERVAAFDVDLRNSGIPGRIRSCRVLLDVSLGHAQGNHSYGGICSLQFGKIRREFLLCNDQLVGHFALAADFVVSREWVARFVRANCVGG